MSGPAHRVVVVGGTVEARRATVTALDDALGSATGVRALDDPAADLGAHVPEVVVALVGGPSLGQMLEELAAAGIAPPARLLVVTDRGDHDELSAAFDQGRLDGVLARPLDPGTLAHHTRALLRRAGAPGGSHASAGPGGPDHGRPEPPTTLPVGTSGLLRDLELDDATLTGRLLQALDTALGPRPVLHLVAGTRLTHQGADVTGVFVVRSGSVALDRETPRGHLRLHHATTGPVVGLLSLTQRRRAYFTAVATTDVDVVHLTIEQLDLAMHRDPEVGATMATATVRALARRLQHSEHLQIERAELYDELDEERHALTETLRALEAARFELVEQARMATLGELAAGVAHELNNPVAALERAVAFVAEDLTGLLAGHPQSDAARRALEQARTREARSTADERAARARLSPAVGDDLARRLVALGIDDPEEGARLAADPPLLDVVERASGVGAALRNLELASGRIGGLVESLRAHARPRQAAVEGVDVHTSVDDALRLVAHRLEGVEVDRRYEPLPTIRADPGPLSQVWTNLLVNAAEALDGSGRIEIHTKTVGSDHVRVEIIDDGPGIDPDLLPRLLEPRFTTKAGVVRYGLGLGLPIAKRIVDAHGGRLELTSRPGQTTAAVTLSVTGPDPAEEKLR